MVTPSVGSVILVKFPFSDLSASKLRPAIVLADAGRNDWILCQITSNPYSDTKAVRIIDTDFISGSLMRISYARPSKLFSANTSLMTRIIGDLTEHKQTSIIDAVIGIFKPTA